MIYGEKFLKHSILNEALSLVNEAYIGKTPALLEAEKAIHELRAVYDIKKNWQATPEVKAIEDAFKKQFGMDHFSFTIIPEMNINAKTYPVGSRFDIIRNQQISNIITADGNGFRFKDNNGIIVVTCIYAGMLLSDNITDAELVAVMLHEIGHNFADIISNDCKLSNENYYKFVLIYVIIDAIMTRFRSLGDDIPMLFDNYNSVQVFLKKHEKTKNKFFGFLDYLDGSFNDKRSTIRVIFNRYMNAFIGRIFSIDKVKTADSIVYSDYGIKKNANRQNEVIADKFAAVYGYGVEQASALSKFNFIKDPSVAIIEKMPYGKAVLIQNEKVSVDYFVSDVHPHTIQRINTMIEALEFDMNKKDLDPELRKVIKQQVKDLNNIKESFVKINKNDDEVDKIIKTFAAIVDDKFPEATTAELEKSINKSIDDLCSGKKKIK